MLLLKRLVRSLPLLLLSPVLMAIRFVALLATDIFRKIWEGQAKACPTKQPSLHSASVVIPNWNGKDLLEQYLPSVVEALAGNPENEIVVVDNGSNDGSADFVRAAFPQVTLIALPRNLGFGGGSNTGIRAARNHIVVLLNSDMRVAPDFLAPLLEGFR
ncbi:MAG: glycosyltransferase, partial [Bryobacteraceae bacterium]